MLTPSFLANNWSWSGHVPHFWPMGYKEKSTGDFRDLLPLKIRVLSEEWPLFYPFFLPMVLRWRSDACSCNKHLQPWAWTQEGHKTLLSSRYHWVTDSTHEPPTSKPLALWDNQMFFSFLFFSLKPLLITLLLTNENILRWRAIIALPWNWLINWML